MKQRFVFLCESSAERRYRVRLEVGSSSIAVLTDQQLKPPDVTSHLRWPAAGVRFRGMHHRHQEERTQPPARVAPSVHFPSSIFVLPQRPEEFSVCHSGLRRAALARGRSSHRAK